MCICAEVVSSLPLLGSPLRGRNCNSEGSQVLPSGITKIKTSPGGRKSASSFSPVWSSSLIPSPSYSPARNSDTSLLFCACTFHPAREEAVPLPSKETGDVHCHAPSKHRRLSREPAPFLPLADNRGTRGGGVGGGDAPGEQWEGGVVLESGFGSFRTHLVLQHVFSFPGLYFPTAPLSY